MAGEIKESRLAYESEWLVVYSSITRDKGTQTFINNMVYAGN